MIAEQLGLSTATVSLALRSSPLVAEETKKRVQQVAEDLGYIYNRSAASLRTARTNIVGLVVHDILNPYFAELVSALEIELGKRNQTVLLCNHGDDPARQRNFLETLLQYRADGVILCPSTGTEAKDVDRLERAGLPAVLAAREIPGLESAPSVRGDDRGGIASATRHLIELGHRRIAFIGGRVGSFAGGERRAGYQMAMEAAGLPVDSDLVLSGHTSRIDGRRAAEAVMANPKRPTAVVCFNDLVALGMMTEFKRSGVEPGRDLAMTGYDDIDECSAWSPALTSVWNGQQDVGRLAVETLLLRIDGRETAETRRLVPTQLRIRETSCAPAA
jgi:LacI family transcriptional regulator